jgi:hypothetical protein
MLPVVLVGISSLQMSAHTYPLVNFFSVYLRTLSAAQAVEYSIKS